jgi:hypothetical protein
LSIECSIPRMEVTYNEEGVAEIGDVADDPSEGDPFPVESVPICVSIAKVSLFISSCISEMDNFNVMISLLWCPI